MSLIIFTKDAKNRRNGGQNTGNPVFRSCDAGHDQNTRIDTGMKNLTG